MGIDISDNKTENLAVAVGQIEAPAYLWRALESLRWVETTRGGTLIVFSKDVRGRIGVFYNSYISGALLDSDPSISGLDALQRLLASKDGMFAFRPCLGDENEVLSQSLGVDLADLLSFKGSHDPAEALQRLRSAPVPIMDSSFEAFDDVVDTGTFVVFSDSLLVAPGATANGSAANGADANGTDAAGGDVPQATNDNFNYLDWFAQSGNAGDSGAPNALSKLLLKSVPATISRPEGSTLSTISGNDSLRPLSDIELYERVLSEERDKVLRDLESAAARNSGSAAPDASMGQLSLFQDLLKSEEERVKQWSTADLDAIQTPKLSGAHRKAIREHEAGCNDVLKQSSTRVDAREFVKLKAAEEETLQPPEFQRKFQPALAIGALVVLMIIFGFSSQMTNLEVRKCLAEAKADIRLQRWNIAILSLNDALAKDPNCGQAYFYRGIAFEETDEQKRAEADFKAARQHGVSAADVALVEAGFQLRQEDWKKVLEICDKAIKDRVNSPAIYRLRANAEMHLQQYETAKGDLEKSLAACKNDPEEQALILADRGFVKIQLKDFDGGAKDFDKAVKVHPDPALYLLQGDAYRKVGRFADAIECYGHSLDLDPKNYDAYVARGICEAKLHQKIDAPPAYLRDEMNRALKDFTRALQINPNGVEALIQRGSLLLSSGATVQALDDLQLAYDLNPGVEETHQKLMIAYGRAKKQVPSLPVMSTRTQSEPKRVLPSDPQQLMIMGYNAMNNGDEDLAISCLVSAVKRRPNDPNARRYLAYAFLTAGDSEAAASQFASLRALAPLTDEDTMKYSDALQRSGNAGKAVQVLLSALAANPDNSKFRVKLAEAYYAAGQNKQGDKVSAEGWVRSTNPEDKRKFREFLNGGAKPTYKGPAAAGTHG